MIYKNIKENELAEKIKNNQYLLILLYTPNNKQYIKYINEFMKELSNSSILIKNNVSLIFNN